MSSKRIATKSRTAHDCRSSPRPLRAGTAAARYRTVCATDLARMANAFHLTTCGMRTHTWLDYVPSLANIADLPSRGDFELLERLGARRVEVPVVGTADWHGPLAQWIDSAAAASS